MSFDKLLSALRQATIFVGKTTDRIIYIKNRTADFIGCTVDRTKVLVGIAKDKTAVFLSDVRYETKGHAYNLYDKVRFVVSDLTANWHESDVIMYRGMPKTKFRKRVAGYFSAKMNSAKNRMPESMPEAVAAVGASMRSTKRKVRKINLRFKEICIDGFEYSKEYVTGINKSTVAGLSAIAIGGFAFTFMLTTIVSSYAMGVTINGEKVGFVESEEEFAVLVEDVEKVLSAENHNAEIEIDENAIELDSMAESKKEVTMLDEDKLKETIVNSNAVTANAAAITIDGQPVLYVGTKEDAQAVLQSIRNKYNVAGEDVVAGFVENVGITETEVDVNSLMPTSNAISFLLTGNEVVEQYTVKEDDTDWDIAIANGLTEKDIRKANPDINTKVIKEGDIINISKMEPHVHMEIVATVNVKEKTNYKTEKVETDELYEGETQVQSEGKRGQVSVTKRAVYVNGKETSAQEISKVVLSKPKARVVLVGTKEKPEEPAYTGNSYSSGSSSSSSGSSSSTYRSGGGSYVSGYGTLSNPMRNMELSSPFGNRGGRFHSGADFRNPAGTPIYAAAGGKVTSSGYDGAYGNTVRISHGNGMTTVYAHCQSLYVRSGATVSKGQQIATVGRTGRATGNHLHFEVRINGSARNPLSYL